MRNFFNGKTIPQGRLIDYGERGVISLVKNMSAGRLKLGQEW
jgi:hypothetical protein